MAMVIMVIMVNLLNASKAGLILEDTQTGKHRKIQKENQ